MSLLKTNLAESDFRRREHCALSSRRKSSSNQREGHSVASTRRVFQKSILPQDNTREWLLVQRAAEGDIDAFHQLVIGHTARLLRVASAVLHNQEDAEEALQEGLLSAYRGLKSFQGRSRFSTWLERVVVNSALMVRRRHVQRETSLDEILERTPHTLYEIADPTLNPEQVYGAAEIATLIKKKLGELPPQLQRAFRLHEMDGLSYETCAAQLGVPRGTLKSQVTRARRRLANSLRPVLSMTARQPERLCFEN